MIGWHSTFTAALTTSQRLTSATLGSKSLAATARRERRKLAKLHPRLAHVKVKIVDLYTIELICTEVTLVRSWREDYLEWLGGDGEEFIYSGEITPSDRIFLAKNLGNARHDFARGFLAVRR